MLKTNQYKGVLPVLVLFGLIFCSISLVNHYNFRTYAWDLGINNNAIFDYAHFRWNDCMLLQPQYKNILGDHFTIYPILVCPLFWLTGTYTMLIVQIIAILLGGLGIYKLFLLKTNNQQSLALMAMIHFFSIWGIYSALAFDYHDNVIAAMLVPWLFYSLEKEKYIHSFFLLILVCIGKENMALWGFFICIGLLLLNMKNKKRNKFLLFGAAFCLIYFVAMIKVVIPNLSNTKDGYHHFNYAVLGNNFGEAFKTIFNRPLFVLNTLVANTSGNPDGDGAKMELHKMVLFSGGIFLFFKPQYLIMLIPIYAQKLFNDDFTKWGLNSHYSIEFVPILTICLFDWITDRKKYQLPIGIGFCLITFGSTISSMDHRVSKWYSPEQTRFYSANHYKINYNLAEIRNGLSAIPKNVSVSATNSLVPHLAFRDYIYQYPDGENQVEYIVLFDNENYYPLSKEEFLKRRREFLTSKNWEIIHNSKNLLIVKRRVN